MPSALHSEAFALYALSHQGCLYLRDFGNIPTTLTAKIGEALLVDVPTAAHLQGLFARRDGLKLAIQHVKDGRPISLMPPECIATMQRPVLPEE